MEAARRPTKQIQYIYKRLDMLTKQDVYVYTVNNCFCLICSCSRDVVRATPSQHA